MIDAVSILEKTPLFDGLSAAEIRTFVAFSGGKVGRFKRNDIVILEGAPNRRIGIILRGGITAERVFPDGEIATASEMSAGGVIGDVLSGSSAVSPVTVIAASDCDIFFLPLSAFIEPNAEYSDIQVKLTRNLIMDISDKYFEMEKRVSILSSGNLRRKISLYLCNYCRNCGKGEYFSVAHTREQQAHYLGCERTALSRELAKMKKEGLIDYDRNHFRVIPGSHICRMAE